MRSSKEQMRKVRIELDPEQVEGLLLGGTVKFCPVPDFALEVSIEVSRAVMQKRFRRQLRTVFAGEGEEFPTLRAGGLRKKRFP